MVLGGSGLGTGETSRKILETVALEGEKPAVIDADGLNLLGAHREWLDVYKRQVHGNDNTDLLALHRALLIKFYFIVSCTDGFVNRWKRNPPHRL